MSMQGCDGMELGKQIKMHRQEAELSQEELSQSCLCFKTDNFKLGKR